MIRRKTQPEAPCPKEDPCPTGNGSSQMSGYSSAGYSVTSGNSLELKSRLKEGLRNSSGLTKSLGKYEEGRKLIEVMVMNGGVQGVVDICIDEMGICFGEWDSRDSICQRCGVREICKLNLKERESN
jgi:hypothetical protein